MKVIKDKSKCISCGSCAAVSPEAWINSDDGQLMPKGAQEFEDRFEKEIENDEEKKQHETARDACPMQAISIE
jgi:ferredoxin